MVNERFCNHNSYSRNIANVGRAQSKDKILKELYDTKISKEDSVLYDLGVQYALDGIELDDIEDKLKNNQFFCHGHRRGKILRQVAEEQLLVQDDNSKGRNR